MSIFEKFRRQTPAPAKNSAPGKIGIDIGNSLIQLCQIRPRQAGKYSIYAKTSISFTGGRAELLANPKRLKKLVAQGLREKKFKGKTVVALMPWEDVKIMLLTYKSSISDVDGEVIKMLANRVEGSVDDYVVDYIPVRCNPSDEEHMVVATVAQKHKVELLLNCLISCGLEVDSLDVAPTALRRLVSALYVGPTADNVLLIHSYLSDSYVTVISGRRLLFNQSVAFGETLLLERIARELDLSIDSARALVLENGIQRQSRGKTDGSELENSISTTLLEIVKPCFLDLVNEINRVMVFTAAETHGIPVSRVCLFGSLEHWPGAQDLLLSLLDLESDASQTRFNEIFQDENDDTRIPWEGLFSDLSIAMGLALRGLIPNE